VNLAKKQKFFACLCSHANVGFFYTFFVLSFEPLRHRQIVASFQYIMTLGSQ